MQIVHINLSEKFSFIKEIKKNGVIYINDNYKGGAIKIIPLASF